MLSAAAAAYARARGADPKCSFGDFVAEAAQASGEFRGGLGFVRGEFWIPMKIDVQIVGAGIDGVDFFGAWRLRAGVDS